MSSEPFTDNESSSVLKNNKLESNEALPSKLPTDCLFEDTQSEDVYCDVEVCDTSNPLTVDYISQRISEVCSEHYERLIEFFKGVSDEEKKRLYEEICGK